MYADEARGAVKPQPNPLRTDSAKEWEALIESVGPAALLVVIERRMSTALKRRLTPEDLLQETLLQAWRDRKSMTWSGLKSFRAWLLTIADNRIRDTAARETAQKRGGATPAVPFSILPGGDGTDSGTPSADALVNAETPSWIATHKEHAIAIREALERVSDELRDVLYLRLMEQRSTAETAAQLGITTAAVRYRLRKGTEIHRDRLRAAIGSRTRTISTSQEANNPAPS